MKVLTVTIILFNCLLCSAQVGLDSVSIWKNKAAKHEELSNYDSAIHYYGKISRLLRSHSNSSGDSLIWVQYFWSLNRLYNNHFDAGYYEKADLIARDALKELNLIWPDGSIAESEIDLSVGTAYYRFQMTDSARLYLERSLSLKEKYEPENVYSIFEVELLLAGVYTQEGSYNNAISTYNKVIAHYISDPVINQDMLGRAYYYLGNLYADYLGDLQKGLEHHLLLFRLRVENSELNRAVGAAYEIVGIDYSLLGKYDKALDYFTKALSIYQQVLNEGNPAIEAVMNNISSALIEKGNYTGDRTYYEKALRYQQQILPRRQRIYPELSYKMGSIYHQMGLSLSLLGKTEAGLQNLVRCEKIFERLFGPELLELATVKGNIAKSLLRAGDAEKAIDKYNEALALVLNSTQGKHPVTADLYNQLAELYAQEGHTTNALENYQKAIVFNVRTFEGGDDFSQNPDPQMDAISNNSYLISLHGKALQYTKLISESDHLDKADSTWQLAVGLIDKMRKNFSSEDMKLNLQRNALPVYQSMIDNLFSCYERSENVDYLKRIFGTVEKSKSMVLLESLKADDALRFAGLPDKIIEREASLRSSVNFHKNQLYQLLGDPASPDSNQILTLRSTLVEKQDAYDSILVHMENNYPEYYQLKYGDYEPEVKELQKALDKETLLIEYFISNQFLYRIDLGQAVFDINRLSIDDNFNRNIKSYLDFLSHPETFQHSDPGAFVEGINNGYEIYRQLFTEKANISKYRTLLIVPDGILGYLPFESLATFAITSRDSEIHYLVKEKRIRYAYSAKLSTINSSKIKNNSDYSFLGFAPEYQPNYRLSAARTPDPTDTTSRPVLPLQFNQKEVQSINERLKGEVVLGSEAQKITFLAKAPNSAVLHLAMHGYTNDRDPLYSGLLFSGGSRSGQDDFLYAYELYAMELNAEMVVLSACNSGTGELRNGEGIMSLSRAFRYAGCPNLVTSLWPADDLATFDLMENFYDGIQRGMAKDEALQQAKLDYLRTHDNVHPYYWANFILIGDDQPVNWQGTSYWYYFIAFFIVLIISILYLRNKTFSSS